MSKIFEWLGKRPATKAGWFAAGTGIITVLIISFQTCLLNRQTNLLDRQTKISETQALLLNNQIETSTEPFIDIKIITDNKGSDTLLVNNKGNYSVSNIQVHQIYFAKIANHGWYVSLPTNPLYSEKLDPRKKWSLNISNYAKFYKEPPMAKSFIIQGGLEYLVILVSFERTFDGKSYLTILPGFLVRTEHGIERWPEGTGISGPLSKICNQGLELTLEYLKRRPFPKDYEYYNSSYPVDYNPTGCLGQIEWTN